MQHLSLRRFGAGLFSMCAVVGTLALAACDDDKNSNGETDGGSLLEGTAFAPVHAATTDAEKRAVIGSKLAVIDGKAAATDYVTILRSGEQKGASASLNTFGQILDDQKQPLLTPDGVPAISNANDFSSLIKVGSKLFAISQFEIEPAAVYLTELAQDSTTGKLSATKTTALDLSGIHGLWNPCAGSVTPWNTHLGSEEYEPNAAGNYANDTFYKAQVRYFGGGSTLGGDASKGNPYFWGYPVEFKIKDEAGNTEITKHYSMGRFAHELSYVMPNQKTVYESDDGSDVGFYRYEADKAGDLSAGTLYAAKWHQVSADDTPAESVEANIEWIKLGSAKDSDVAALIDKGTKFSDIFDKGIVTAGACAEGFKSINVNGIGQECLKLKAGQETAAAFLETRRYASYLGASVEFRKEEGITFDPDSKKLWVAYSNINTGMLSAPRPGAATNDVKLKQNNCGGVMAYDVDSNFIVTKVAGAVVGIPGDGSDPRNTCSLDSLGEPDNISFMPGQKTLLIGEDATNTHQNDVVWAYNVEKKTLTRIASTPYGAETTSLYYYPDFSNFGYIVTVVQHPYGETDQDQTAPQATEPPVFGPDNAATRSYFGYVGALPAHK